MRWDVVTVRPSAHLQLDVTFADGTCGRVRFEQSHLTGVFAALKDEHLFAQAFIDRGGVVWPGEIDLAPDAMYAAIKATGEWILR